MNKIANSFFKARDIYETSSFVQKKMRFELVEIAKKHGLLNSVFDNILEIGCGNGSFTKIICSSFLYRNFYAIDIAPFDDFFRDMNVDFCMLDMNNLGSIGSICEQYNLILSNASLQWGNQEYILRNIDSLCDDGAYLLFGVFGSNNLYEVKDICGVGLDYLDINDYMQIMSNKWNILDVYKHTYSVVFDDALDIFRHFRNTGTNVCGDNFRITKKMLEKFEKDKNNTITYEPIYILAQKAAFYQTNVTTADIQN